MTKNNTTKEMIPLTWDYAFKNVFGRYGNEDILRKFLSVILKENITKVEIHNGELPREIKNKKLGILDIRAEIDNKYLVDIEMQVGDEKNLSERAMYYLSKLYSDQINQSEDYRNMKKAIVIAIIDFSYYKRGEYHSVAHMKFEENKNPEERLEQYEGYEQKLVTDKLEYHVIDLRAFRRKEKATEELADWLNLLVGNMEGVKMAEKKSKEMEKAVKVVEEMGHDPETRELYRLIQKGRIEENTRISNALAEGREEAKKEYENEKMQIAIKLLKMDIDIKEVEEITGIEEEQLKKLLKK